MSHSDQDKIAAPDGAKPACTALVPLVATAQSSLGQRRRCSLNPMFVTHLIATAQRAPQTRRLYRATFADAETAYRANQNPVRVAGTRTRQII
jgi:hypothetical protein